MKKGISELTREEVEFDETKIKYYGVEVYENLSKTGKFLSFKKRNYIKTTEKIYVDYLLSDIRKWFDKVELTKKKEHLKRKKDKTVKAISKDYEVVNKDAVYIAPNDYLNLLKSNKHRTLFFYKKVNYYFIFDKFFRSTETDEYLFLDTENKIFIKTGFDSVFNKPTKKDLLKWEKEYELK